MICRIALAAALLASPAAAQRLSLPPVDQAPQDPKLVAFRETLKAAVEAQDIDAVIKAACPDLYLSHDGAGGPDELREKLSRPDETQDHGSVSGASLDTDEVWKALAETLAAPGYFDAEGEFWMPYQWQIKLPADLDPKVAYFVTGANVTMRSAPFPQADALQLISHEVVLVPVYNKALAYQQVILTDGARGYMHRDYLWSMTGYRAALAKSETGDWQLCTFVTGD